MNSFKLNTAIIVATVALLAGPMTQAAEKKALVGGRLKAQLTRLAAT